MNSKRYRQRLKTATGWENQYPIIDPIEGTYAQIKSLKDSNALIPSQWYKITNYKSIWIDPTTSTKQESYFEEPLLILAITVNSFDSRALSSLYPNDIIYYSLTNSSTALPSVGCAFYHADSRGYIFRRILPNNNDCPFDSRGIFAFRYSYINNVPEFDNLAKNKGSLVRIGTSFYVAKKNTVAGAFNNLNGEFWINYHTEGYSLLLDRTSPFLMYVNNNVLNIPVDISYGFKSYACNVNNLKIEPFITRDGGGHNWLNLNNIFFNHIASSAVQPANNIKFGCNCRDITFNGQFSNITIGNDCYNITLTNVNLNLKIGDNSCYNFIKDSQNNIIGNNFQYNIIEKMSGNIIGNNFEKNIISKEFNYNTIGSKFQKKTIKNLFQYNKTTNNLFEEKDLDSALKLFDENMPCEITKGINTQIPETVYAIRFFDPIGLTDVVNVI